MGDGAPGDRLPVVTWRLGVLAAASAPIVLVLPLPAPYGLVVVAGILLALGTLDLARAPAPARALDIRRELPGIIPLDGEGEVVWEVANRTARGLTVAIADELAPSLGASTRRARLRVPARGRARARATLRPRRRGRFRPLLVTARVEGPWGLAARQGRLRVAGELRVYPSFRSRREAELRIEKARILEVGLRSARGRGGGTEFEALREYTVDDEFRRIDWAATARTGRAIVREYRPERNQTILVLLDTGRVMAARVADVPRLDHAMDAVMALTTVATRLGDRAGLVAFGAEVRSVVPPGHARGQVGRVSEAMYELEAELAESDYRGAFAAALSRFRRRALIVVLSELAEQAVGETLLPALPILHDHLVLLGSVQDPAVVGWARSRPAEPSGAYRKAAAAAALARRARATALLTARGATVVDAPPGELAGRLADAYLKVKATGRL